MRRSLKAKDVRKVRRRGGGDSISELGGKQVTEFGMGGKETKKGLRLRLKSRKKITRAGKWDKSLSKIASPRNSGKKRRV